MIRPEAAATLMRWRETLVGLGLAGLALYWMGFTGGGLLRWISVPLLGGAIALMLAGVQRARFRQATLGPGIVQINERRVSYFGPLTGGVADLADLTRITLDPHQSPPHWRLEIQGQPPLMIPVNAKGHDQLFDAFATLPGIDMTHLISMMMDLPQQPTAVWLRAGADPDVRRLH